MASTSSKLYQTLLSVARFEIVGEPNESAKQLRFMGRVRDRASSKTWTNLVVRSLLQAAKHAPWSVDVSRQYFLRGSEDELLWGWRIIFQAQNGIGDHLEDIVMLIRESVLEQPRQGEVTEMPLVGTRPGRNQLVNGKGATSVKDAK